MVFVFIGFSCFLQIVAVEYYTLYENIPVLWIEFCQLSGRFLKSKNNKDTELQRKARNEKFPY